MTEYRDGLAEKYDRLSQELLDLNDSLEKGCEDPGVVAGLQWDIVDQMQHIADELAE